MRIESIFPTISAPLCNSHAKVMPYTACFRKKKAVC